MEQAGEAVIALDQWSVLVIEDDDDVRATLVETLRDSGFVVEAAGAAGAAIDAWRGDVILTDTLGSPYSTEVVAAYLTALRSRFAAGLVVLTGHNGAAVDAAQLPADAVVMKPFDLVGLIGVIAKVARDSRDRDARDPDRSSRLDYYRSAHEEGQHQRK
jgi:CheY-like chemotaxis protein